MAERTTVRLPEDLLRRARIKAAAEGSTLTALIEDGLRLVVTGAPAEASAKRKLPRTSKATGGLLPGVTLREAEELEDLEYFERMKHVR